MSHSVHIQISFVCNDNTPIAALAEKHIGLVEKRVKAALPHLVCPEPVLFLKALSQRTGGSEGGKGRGGISFWGWIGRYVDEEEVVDYLSPFFKDMLTGEVGGILSFEHILLFSEHEGNECCSCYEIMLSKNPEDDLVCNVHENLPFSWNQM